MTINHSQIALMESQVMADTDDGGGRQAGTVIAEGEINNTFPDISRLDRVYGRTQLRKLFLAVLSDNQDTLLGAHTILTRMPADPRVKVTLFQTGSHTDRRAEAKDRIESYVTKSTEAAFWLWGDQLQGQRSLAALQRLNGRPPEPGEVYAIQGGSAEQYVRVTQVEVGRQSFTAMIGSNFVDFELQTLQISLANQLLSDHAGSQPMPTGRQAGAAKVLNTQITAAARYYGASAITASASVGDTAINISSPYNHLVPSAQREQAITDRIGGPGAAPVLPCSTVTMTVTASSLSPDSEGFKVAYTGRGIVPGTLRLTVSGVSFIDKAGQLWYEQQNMASIGSEVDYQAGRLKMTTPSSQNWNMTFLPGAKHVQQSHSASVEVTEQTQSLTYVFSPQPAPAPGTTIVEYRVLGKWATLVDGGDGALRGDGVGQVNYSTGTVSVTLAGLPDIDSRIIISWGDPASVEIAPASTSKPKFKLTLSAEV